MANGTHTETQFQAKEINIHVSANYCSTLTTAVVLPDLEWDLILGRPWLKEENPDIDWGILQVRDWENREHPALP